MSPRDRDLGYIVATRDILPLIDSLANILKENNELK